MLFSYKRKPFPRSSGFTLIEAAIVLLISGVFLVAAVRVVLPLYEKSRMIDTNEKLRLITNALDAYAVTNYRLPCPADPRPNPVGPEPYGSERFSTVTGAAIPTNCSANAANWKGIIPFATLGIPETYARDGWGRFFTYAISPAFALTPNGSPLAADILVHPACRTREWFYLKDKDVTDSDSYGAINPRKARFCCVAAAPNGSANIYTSANDLDIQDAGGTSVLATANPRQAANYANTAVCDSTPTPPDDPDCVPYQKATEIYTTHANVPLQPTDVSTGIAYLVLSHGKNGYGALLASGGQVAPPTGGGPNEDENTNANRVFIYRPLPSDAAADYYDDIMIWKTQDMIFAEQGESCATP